jgi:hypothetical protein
MLTEPIRPDYVHCVRHEHLELTGQSWCGRVLRDEWAFVNPSHAAENGRQGGRLVACPACVVAITAALQTGHDDAD